MESVLHMSGTENYPVQVDKAKIAGFVEYYKGSFKDLCQAKGISGPYSKSLH